MEKLNKFVYENFESDEERVAYLLVRMGAAWAYLESADWPIFAGCCPDTWQLNAAKLNRNGAGIARFAGPRNRLKSKTRQIFLKQTK